MLNIADELESGLLKNLEAARIATATVAAAIEVVTDTNPHSRGDLVIITNDLRDEFGITGRVIQLGATYVTICDTITWKTLTRAWWNSAPVTVANRVRRTTYETNLVLLGLSSVPHPKTPY